MKKFYLFALLGCFAMQGLLAQNSELFNTAYDTVSFEELLLDPDSYWNGSDASGGFSSGGLFFINHYDPEFFSWDGWAYSNMADDTTAGFMNQYSAITAAGYDPAGSGGANYAVSWVPTDWMTGSTIPVTLVVEEDEAREFAGFYITNSTWTALSMELGDDFAKKFGGESEDDPDWLRLAVWGYNNGTASNDTVEFYLADYRFANNDEDYIVKTWEWVDLSVLGEVDSLKFDLWSTDIGDYGMNTPAYFCADNFYLIPDDLSVHETLAESEFIARIYPNPSLGLLRINLDNDKSCKVEIFDLTGRKIYSKHAYNSDEGIDISNYPQGIYPVKVNDRFSGYVVRK